MSHETETKRFSGARLKAVMQRPKLNWQETGMLATGIVSGAVLGDMAFSARVLNAINNQGSIQRPLIEGVVEGLACIPLTIVFCTLPVALNRGWGEKTPPIIKEPDSPDTSTNKINSFLRTNGRRIAAGLGIYGAPLVTIPSGLMLAFAGNEAPANALMCYTIANVVLGMSLVPNFLLRDRERKLQGPLTGEKNTD